VCWATTEQEARATAHHWWPNGALPRSLHSELALPSEFAEAADLVTEDAVARHVVCGPDPQPIARAVDRFVAAGFTTVYLHQVGPDQLGFLDFAKGELLPRFAS
jgi:hypothetical protein